MGYAEQRLQYPDDLPDICQWRCGGSVPEHEIAAAIAASRDLVGVRGRRWRERR
jgi:hypothetical protein